MVAEDYITPNLEVEYWEKHINGMLIKEWASFIKGSVLDIGCNHGAETLILAKLPNVKWVAGVDINPEAIKIARERNTEPNPNFQFYVMDICKEQPYTWDTIVSFHTLEHLVYLYDALEHMYAGLANGGQILVSVPNEYAYPSEHHIHHFSLISLAMEFERVGFKVLEACIDQREDLHGNKHNILNLRATKDV